MCGIAGITWSDQALVERMAGTLAHRGPDRCGVYVDEDVSLGHRRLSIIDLSEAGTQPMTDAGDRYWMVYNGEIYNFRELRTTLEGLGHRFRTRTDSEVLLAAYREWGTGCLDRLNGMFAFAVWDTVERELFLARDRIGIKPLYFWKSGARFAFASEIKAILACEDVPREVDPQAVYEFIGYEYVPAPGTAFRGIQELEPGHWMRIRGDHLEIRQYWDMRLEAVERSRAEHEELLRDTMEASVTRRLVSDVPLGVFLSGGLDSSALVAWMARSGVEEIQTFSLGYADRTFSELEYARIVSNEFGTEHRELIIDPVTPETIETVVWHLDEPMTDLSAVPFYLLCKKVREFVTVCLSGEGGDEIMVGYDRFKASKAHGYYSILPRLIRNGLVAPLVAGLPDQRQKKGAVNLLKRFIAGGALDEEGGHLRWQYFSSPAQDEELFSDALKNEVVMDPFAPLRPHLERAGPVDRLDREIYIDTRFIMPNSLLHKVDKLSMAHGLEVRVPLLDHTLVEALATMPGALKLEGFTTKSIFRTGMKGILPDVILNRGKQGYSLPIKNWLREDLRDFMMDTVRGSALVEDLFNVPHVERLIDEHMSMKANHNHVLWGLINLAVWHAQSIASAAPPFTSPTAAGSRDEPVVVMTAS